MRDNAIFRGETLALKIFGRRDEIRKRVLLVRKLALTVPAPALLGAAAHMGDCIDEAAVDQRKPVGLK